MEPRPAHARRPDEAVPRAAAPGGLALLADRLRGLPPSCGPVRLVGVDGHAGSGKTTLSGRLARALGGAPVVHLDDLGTHDELFGWERRLFEQVLRPLAGGWTARYAHYDWVARRFGDRPAVVPCAPVVLVEGVGAGRRAVRPYLACLLWMERPRRSCWERGRRRDGPELDGFWRGWMRAESEHFAADPSRPFADHLVMEQFGGYRLLPGPR